MEEPLKVWFVREILAHEAALVRYLNRTWPRRSEVHDLRQEIYTRIYQSAKQSRPRAPKNFLFQAARHLMADRMRRGRVVSIEAVEDLDELSVMVDDLSPERQLSARQDLKRLSRAFDLLHPKCREVVWLRKVDELSQKEVAKLLGISVRTVEHHIYVGMQQLAETFFGNKMAQGVEISAGANSNESEHGKQQTD